jgi:hypothetical protein
MTAQHGQKETPRLRAFGGREELGREAESSLFGITVLIALLRILGHLD